MGPPMPLHIYIHDQPPAQCRIRVADHEAVALECCYGLREPYLCPSLVARLQLVAVKQKQLALNLRGARVERDGEVVSYGAPCVPDGAQADIDIRDGLERPGGRGHPRALEVIDSNTREGRRG